MKWSGNDNYSTPEYLRHALDDEFGFDLDPCPLNEHPTLDGLDMSWDRKRVFVNPPWSDITPWVNKAFDSKAQVVCFVLPARTDTAWFHALKDGGAELRFFRKRVVFVDHSGQPRERPTDGALVAVIRPFFDKCVAPRDLHRALGDEAFHHDTGRSLCGTPWRDVDE